MSGADKPCFEVGKEFLNIEKMVEIIEKKRYIKLSQAKEFEEKINAGANFLDETLKSHGVIYGVTTGYGDSCTEVVPPENYTDLPVNLSRYHGCGLGAFFDRETTRAIMLVRLNTLVQGYSGVSLDLLRKIMFFIDRDILPLIPEEGSVGASGDLTPLSYLAGALIGERDVLYDGKVFSSGEVLSELKESPYRFRPKEAIAIMNGTAVMNAVAARAFSHAHRIAELACCITSFCTIALKGNVQHFHERLFELKPHQGQALAAQKIRKLFGDNVSVSSVVPSRIQDPYSIRCAPHVIGVFYDAGNLLRSFIETEMNSANDNPLVDPVTQSIYHGGHFYGGHICFAMDSLKNIVANIADLIDRQLALLVDVKYNRGLPPNLSGTRKSLSFNHGFKAVQIAASAWAAEALKNTMPASVFSRSTECHNQDKVSMGTIAARDCIRVIELTYQILAATLFASAQELRLREKNGEFPSGMQNMSRIVERFFSQVDFLEDDRPLDKDLQKVIRLIKEDFFNIDKGN
jgi:histidine ammonia-lyase